MAGGIHHQNQLARVVGHRDILALQAGGRQLMKRGHGKILIAEPLRRRQGFLRATLITLIFLYPFFINPVSTCPPIMVAENDLH
ncbi:hypothetical protein D3C75_1048380 [compost metagenome]